MECVPNDMPICTGGNNRRIAIDNKTVNAGIQWTNI